MRFAQSTCRNFRQTDALNFALTHQITERAHTVFNGHFFVPTVQVIQIDHIGLQTFESIFTGLANGFGSTIDDAHPFAIAILIDARHAAFAGQGELLAVRL